MREFDFRLIFSGLLAFVPDTSFDPADGLAEPGLVTALMPDVRRPLSMGGNYIIPVHQPLLMFDPRDVVSGDLDPHFIRRNRRGREGAIYSILDHELTLGSSLEGSQLETVRQDPEGANAGPDDELSLNHVLRLKHLFAGQAAPAHPLTMEGKAGLAARVRIDHGRMYSRSLHEGQDGPKKWSWRNLGEEAGFAGDREVLVAMEVVLELRGLERPVDLWLRYFSGATRRKFSFYPSQGRSVEVYLKHIELEGELGLPTPTPRFHEDQYLVDWDVRAFRHLVAVDHDEEWRDVWTDVKGLGGDMGLCKSVVLDSVNSI